MAWNDHREQPARATSTSNHREQSPRATSANKPHEQPARETAASSQQENPKEPARATSASNQREQPSHPTPPMGSKKKTRTRCLGGAVVGALDADHTHVRDLGNELACRTRLVAQEQATARGSKWANTCKQSPTGRQLSISSHAVTHGYVQAREQRHTSSIQRAGVGAHMLPSRGKLSIQCTLKAHVRGRARAEAKRPGPGT